MNHKILEVYIKEQTSEEDVDKVDHDQVNRRFFTQLAIIEPQDRP